MSGEVSDFEVPEGTVSRSMINRSMRANGLVEGDEIWEGNGAFDARRRRPHRASRLKVLKFCVAGALVFTLFVKLRRAARDQLPLHMEGDGYDEAGLSSPFSAPPSSSTAAAEHPERVGNTDAHTEESEEGASLLASEATATPSRPDDQLPLHDSWGLPMLDHFDETLPPDVKQGKDRLAAFVAEGGREKAAGSKQNHAVLSAIAKALSNGSSDTLIGMTVPLHNVKPFHLTEKGAHVPRSVRINKFLGRGGSAIVMEAEDTETHEVFAMRFTYMDKSIAEWYPDEESRFGAMQHAVNLEEQGSRQLCGSMPPDLVASKKGITVPLYTGSICRRCTGLHVGDHYILGRVHLSEKLSGTLSELFKADFDVKSVREYVGRRLLHIVLKLQQAGMSHNDLKWDNMLLRSDGSFVVCDMGSVIAFGNPWEILTRYTPEYREPQLNMQEVPQAYEKGIKQPNASSDLWSLGVLLYELFAGRRCPLAKLGTVEEEKSDEEALRAKFLVENTSGVAAKRGLETAKVPPVWTDLILGLLEPSPERRLTAWEIIHKFSDLLE
ncbi:WGS project CADU00000000 data, contig 00001346, related [Eimeria brunetti]|uniref:WGS project CADU00000000 data, contig 00001346, related n=1 Tax=Eimeria brunetti TaxID=51314 RepID=U6LDT2_9EIME|nr:WGS project CADU00000000 data, contig 00001346, related [Eimeria brunetti]